MTFVSGDAAPWDLDALLGNRGPAIRRTTTASRAVAGFMQSFPSPAYDGRTYQTILTSECPWIGYRVVIRNNGPAYTLDACATSSDNGGAGFNPSPASWKAVTFGGVANPTVPAALGATRPSILKSDIIWDLSVVRNDLATRLPLLYIRTYYATGPAAGYGNTSKPTSTGWSSTVGDAYNLGRTLRVSGAAGNFVSSNQVGFASASPNDNFGMHVAEVEFITMRDVMTVCGMGDSITQGDTSSSNLLAPVHVACAAVSTQEKPIFAMNQGYSSQTTTNFVARIGDMIAAGTKPNVMVYSAYSPNDVSANDTNTMAAALTIMRQNLYAALDLMRSNDITPIISTGLPYAYSTAVDNLRKAFNDEIRALGTRGIIVADYDLQLSNAATPAVIQYPAYAPTNQALHPYDGGYLAMGNLVLAPILQRLAARYFAGY